MPASDIWLWEENGGDNRARAMGWGVMLFLKGSVGKYWALWSLTAFA